MRCDYYEILTLSPQATLEDIRRAYRAMALRFHPDRNSSPEAQAAMIKINEAYEVLSDPMRRESYDGQRQRPPTSGLEVAILEAARQLILQQRPAVLLTEDRRLLQDVRPHRVLVEFGGCESSRVKQLAPALVVIVAAESAMPDRIHFNLPVIRIDALHATVSGDDFPNEACRALFTPLCGRVRGF